MERPSSEDLHPRHGARFAFTRDESSANLSFGVEIYVAGGEQLSGSVQWDARGSALIAGIPEEHWCRHEVEKLVRVLHRKPLPTLLRWRPAPDAV